jgi:hypothetical protein
MRRTVTLALAFGLPTAVIAVLWSWERLNAWDLTQPQATLMAAVVGGPFVLVAALIALRAQRHTIEHERIQFAEEQAEQRRLADVARQDGRRADRRDRLIPLYQDLLRVYSDVMVGYGIAAEKAQRLGTRTPTDSAPQERTYSRAEADLIYEQAHAARKLLSEDQSNFHLVVLLVDELQAGTAISEFQTAASMAGAKGSSFNVANTGVPDAVALGIDPSDFVESCHQVRYQYHRVISALRSDIADPDIP